MHFIKIRVYNISEALDLENISEHSKPHVFKIIREEGKAPIFWKIWSTDRVCVVFKAFSAVAKISANFRSGKNVKGIF